jgi:ISXO2-like transposase domain
MSVPGHTLRLDRGHSLQAPGGKSGSNRAFSAGFAGLQIHDSRRRRRGNVGIPAGISKGCGKGGKPALWLSCFPYPGISTSCFWRNCFFCARSFSAPSRMSVRGIQIRQKYLPLRTSAYQHRISNQKGHPERASELLPRVHQIFSLLKRWLLGTHQESVAGEHLQDYLNEFAFRFNRRKSRSRGKLFYRLVQHAVATEPTTYRQIVDSAIKRK